MRRQIQRRLQPEVFPKIREKLSDELWKKISVYIADPGKAYDRTDYPSRESLEYFYLPLVSLERLNYLWESYFSWYEFQVNTGFAVLFSTPSVMFLTWVKMEPSPWSRFLGVAAGVTVFVALLFWWLWIAARENRAEYQRNLMLLIAGSLVAADKKKDADPET
jgi:hypothetical protein